MTESLVPFIDPHWTDEERREFKEAYERARRDIERECRFGNCVEFVNPDTGNVTGSFGPVGCPCDSGWLARLTYRTRCRLRRRAHRT